MNIKKSQDDDWIIHFQNKVSKFGNKCTVSQHGDLEGNGTHLGLLRFYLLKEKHFLWLYLHTSIYITVSRSL